MPHPRPFVTLVYAQSLDGRIAFRARGERAVFSTREGTAHAHAARAAHDAVLVGIRTVLADDPLLTVRACAGTSPRRVVLDSALAIPLTARLLRDLAEGPPVLVVAAAGRMRDAGRVADITRTGAEVCVVPQDPDGRVSLGHALAALHARGVRSLLVEGGAAVLTSFLRARAADRAEVEVAPCLLGDDALAAAGPLGTRALREAIRLGDVTVARLGDNILLRGTVLYPAMP